MFGDYIHKNIQSTLFNRIDALNRNQVDNPLSMANPNTNQDSFLMGATWARAISAVPDVESNEDGEITKVYPDMLFRLSSDFSVDISSEPPSVWRINEPLSIRSSKNTNRTFRGHNGITGITVTYLNQTTLSTTITWTLNDIKEFELYQNAFLTPSRVVLVEFGWSREKPQEIPDIETSEEMFDFFKANQEKITFYGGDYFATCGIIKNFNYNLVEGGRYECTTELVSMGQQLFKSPKGRDPDQITPSLVNDYFNMDTPETRTKLEKLEKSKRMGKKEKAKIKEIIVDAQKNSFERVMSELNVYIQNLRFGRNPVTGPPDPRGFKTSDQTYTFLGKSWCTWGWFEDNILNTYFGLIIKKSPENEKSGMDDEWIARFNSSWRKTLDDDHKRLGYNLYSQELDPDNLYELNLCKSNENLFTRSPDIIFPGRTIELDEKVKKAVTKDLRDFNDMDMLYRDMNQYFPAFEPEGLENSRGIIRNIVLSADILIEYFSGTSNVGQAIKSLWAYVNSQYGGFWDFDVLTDTNDTTMIGVFDRSITRIRVKDVIDFPDTRNQSTKKDPFKTFQFKVYSKDSLVKDMSFNTELSSEMMTQALYSGNNSTVTKNGIYAGVPGDKDGRAVKAFSALQNFKYLDKETANKDIDDLNIQRDLLLDAVSTPYMLSQVSYRNKKGRLSLTSPDSLTTSMEKTYKATEEMLSMIDEDLDEDVYKWVNLKNDLNDMGIIYDTSGKMLEAYSKSMLYYLNKTDEAFRSVDVPIPFSCTFSIAGIAGIKLYDYFTIDYIPELYREFAVFQINGITHTLGSDGWTTAISALMRVDVDELARQKGREVPDEIMGKIDVLNKQKFIDMINSDMNLPEKMSKTQPHLTIKQEKFVKKIRKKEKLAIKSEVEKWNEENFTNAAVTAGKLHDAMKGGGTKEAKIWAIYEHPEFTDKIGRRVILNPKTRREIESQFNKRHFKFKFSKKYTLSHWFISEMSGDEEKRALNYLK